MPRHFTTWIDKLIVRVLRLLSYPGIYRHKWNAQHFDQNRYGQHPLGQTRLTDMTKRPQCITLNPLCLTHRWSLRPIPSPNSTWIIGHLSQSPVFFSCSLSCFQLDCVLSRCVCGSQLSCKSLGLFFLMGAVCLCNTRLPFVLVTDKITKENHSGRGSEGWIGERLRGDQDLQENCALNECESLRCGKEKCALRALRALRALSPFSPSRKNRDEVERKWPLVWWIRRTVQIEFLSPAKSSVCLGTCVIF